MQETIIYIGSKKMKPFFNLNELRKFVKKNFNPKLVKIYQIRNEQIDSAYRIEHDLFIALAYNGFDELFYIDQDGESFFAEKSKVESEKLIETLFIKI